MIIGIDSAKMKTLISELDGYASILSDISEQIGTRAILRPSLRDVKIELSESRAKVQKLKSIVESAISEYTATEARHTSLSSGDAQTSKIQAYIKDNDAGRVFGRYNFSDHYLDDLGGFTAFLYFFSHCDDNIEAFARAAGKPSNFFKLLTSGTLDDRIADEYMNDRENVKKILSGVVETMFDNKASPQYKGTEIKTIKALDELTDSSVADGLRDILDGSYDANKDLTELSKTIGNVEFLITDYSKNIEALESIRSIAPNNQALNEVIDEVIFDYRNKFTALVRDEVLDKIEEFSKKGFDSISGANYGLVNTVIKGTIGQAPAIDSMDTVIHISTLKAAAIQSYQKAATTVASGTYTDAEFNAYVNSFNLCKGLTLKEYRAMLKYYDNPVSKEHLYLKNQISALERMTYDNFEPATSYSKFNPYPDGSGHGGAFSGASGFAGGGGGGRSGGGF